jgi:peptide chain release factor 1
MYDLQGFLGGNIQDMIDALTVAENAERMKEAEL